MTLRATIQSYASDPRDSERRQFARDVLARCDGANMPKEKFAAFGDEVKALLDKYGITDGEFWTRKLGDDRYLFRIEGTVHLTAAPPDSDSSSSKVQESQLISEHIQSARIINKDSYIVCGRCGVWLDDPRWKQGCEPKQPASVPSSDEAV